MPSLFFFLFLFELIQTSGFSNLLCKCLGQFNYGIWKKQNKTPPHFTLLVLNVAPGNVIGCHPVSELWEKVLRILLDYRIITNYLLYFCWVLVQAPSKSLGSKDSSGVWMRTIMLLNKESICEIHWSKIHRLQKTLIQRNMIEIFSVLWCSYTVRRGSKL